MARAGIERVNSNFKRLALDIAGARTETAVYAILSQGGAAAATMTPVDSSNLINSHYVDITNSGGNVKGRNGYTAEYAGAVHEAAGVLMGQPRANGNGNYWAPAGEPQFLKKGFDLIKPHIGKILKAAYKR